MKGQKDFSLTLVIDGRKYPIKINRSEEEAYRSAAKTIDNKINQYRVTYGDSPNLITQDFIAMTAIQILVENFELGTKNNTEPTRIKLKHLLMS